MENSPSLQLREASLAELFWLHERIAEFPGKASLSFYEERLRHRVSLALVAFWDGELAGFKVGYQSELPEQFYSWMGGVRPEFRRKGIATALAAEQHLPESNGCYVLGSLIPSGSQAFKTVNSLIFLKRILAFNGKSERDI